MRDAAIVWGLQIRLGVRSDLVGVKQSIGNYKYEEPAGASPFSPGTQGGLAASQACGKMRGGLWTMTLWGPHLPTALDGKPPRCSLPLWFL